MEGKMTDLVVASNLPADRNPSLVYVASLDSPASRATMAGCLETLAEVLTGGALGARETPWHELRFQHTAALRAQLTDRFAAATANKHLAALRGVLKAAWQLGLMSAEDYHRAAEVKCIKAETLPAGRALTAGEVAAVAGACDPRTTGGIRDSALLAVLYGAGMRRSEIVALDLEDYRPETGELRIRAGKGRKARLAWATNGARDALGAWLEVRGDAPGPLFCPVDKTGRVAVRRLTPRAVGKLCSRKAREAGVEHFSPHDIRRTFISELLDRGADLATTAELAGHSDVQTTRRYDRRGDATRRKAAELLHWPCRR